MPGLLAPIQIGPLELLNRLVMPPMATRMATADGEVTQPLIEHYRKRAPGVGLVIVEHSYVMPSGQSSPGQLGCYKDALTPGLKRLAEAIQGEGARIALQINHGGIKALANEALKAPAGPSPAVPPVSTVPTRELAVDEIKEIVQAFGQAARRAREAGFNAVEVHGAHGYINNQFLSPLRNNRIDAYGGSFKKRLRFTLEVVNEARKQVGSGIALLYRLGASDMVEGGLTIKDGQRIAAALVEAGVDVIDVSGGIIGDKSPEYTGQGYFVPLAEEIKKAVKVPVIGVGRVPEPYSAAKVIRNGRVDLLAVGRAILADPYWARKAKEALSH